ncbi:cytochrome c biogenesis protein CcdA [Pseudomethylobacillus aquaticus]|uniref:Cytochrome c biogenesis protein CcdA n=1 Tax=Pseudomethylobacillus aquaticus TaxID=2676064 RepID=A0A3N0V0Q6_9PROT|nr:cytochrome c biogenesis CcdA family protein [Pseudomethylobacillus aquaticus]ROH86340.1 cytochrome c biogenesis protein CcdA [Pseudomethylobacillus aquaticus]
MSAELASYGLSFLAGTLSVLAPCVLPLLPILLGSALNTHKLGPLALAAGLAITFTVIGVLIASSGAVLGLEQDTLRRFAAVLLILFGVVLLSSHLQHYFSRLTAGLGNSGNNLLYRLSGDTLAGQFLLGCVLGLVWSPCVGPTLGAAITLASQGESLLHVTLVMAMFGMGAGLPLIALGLLSRQAMLRLRGKLMQAGKVGKQVMGIALLVVGLLILTGFDKSIESGLLDILPTWMTEITTRF